MDSILSAFIKTLIALTAMGVFALILVAPFL
jgi:hypothetical protein